MNTLNNILFPLFLFLITFSIACSFSSTPKPATPQPQSQLILAASILEPIKFSTPEISVQVPVLQHIDILHTIHIEQTQIDEPTEVTPSQVPFSIPLNEPTKAGESTQITLTTETITTVVQETEITETVQIIDSPQEDCDVTNIIALLTKRQSLKLFTPLVIKRRVNKVEKNLATTKAEILALYKENPSKVTSILQTHLPELFT